jgi:plastocyanin
VKAPAIKGEQDLSIDSRLNAQRFKVMCGRDVIRTLSSTLLVVMSLIALGRLCRILAAADSANPVRGRIEVLNSKAKLRGGRADAGGVAVWLSPTQGGWKTEAASPPRGRIEQRDKRFLPHVMVIRIGTEIDFPNHDPFFHNVFSVYDGKTFDLGLYANGESRPVRFDRPGISYIFCNIHPQMSAVIIAVETPYFAVTNPDGTFSINNVPVGNYELHLWHERSDEKQLDALRRIVTVAATAADLGVIRLDEAAFIPQVHKNKHGEDYPVESPAYRRP